jgi:hypothetical protein
MWIEGEGRGIERGGEGGRKRETRGRVYLIRLRERKQR